MNANEREWSGTGVRAFPDPATRFAAIRVHSRLT
jgi:hypothetical protein